MRANIRIGGKRHARIGLAAAQCAGKLLTSFQYERKINRVFFENWFEKTLLKNLPKKRVIIMVNAAFHKKRSCIKSQKIFAKLDLFAAAFAGIPPVEHMGAL